MGERIPELFGREWRTEQVALDFIAAMIAEKGHLGFGLDALCHHVQLQPVGNDEKCLRNRRVFSIARDPLREGYATFESCGNARNWHRPDRID